MWENSISDQTFEDGGLELTGESGDARQRGLEQTAAAVG